MEKEGSWCSSLDRENISNQPSFGIDTSVLLSHVSYMRCRRKIALQLSCHRILRNLLKKATVPFLHLIELEMRLVCLDTKVGTASYSNELGISSKILTKQCALHSHISQNWNLNCLSVKINRFVQLIYLLYG